MFFTWFYFGGKRMEKANKCIVIIKDDFKNILLIQRKVKKTEPRIWSLIECDVKGKATEEKSIDKTIKKNINSIIFNKNHISSIEEDADTFIKVFTGQLKERVVLHKDITACKWIGKKDIGNLDIYHKHAEIVKGYFNKY